MLGKLTCNANGFLEDIDDFFLCSHKGELIPASLDAFCLDHAEMIDWSAI